MTKESGVGILAMAFAVDAARDRNEAKGAPRTLHVTLRNETDASLRILRAHTTIAEFDKAIVDAYFEESRLFAMPIDSPGGVPCDRHSFFVSHGDGTSMWREHVKEIVDVTPASQANSQPNGGSMPTAKLSPEAAVDTMLSAIAGYSYAEASAVLNRAKQTIDGAAGRMIVFPDSIREIKAQAEQSYRERLMQSGESR